MCRSQNASYPKIPIEAVINIQDTKRGAEGEYNRGAWSFETDTYDCEEYGWEEPVDDVQAALYSDYFDAEAVSAEIASDVILRGHEKRVADIVQNTANAAGSTAVANEWDDAANANTSSRCCRREASHASRKWINAQRVGYVPQGV